MFFRHTVEELLAVLG